MSAILLLHVFAVCFWFGVIAIETVLELQSGRHSADADYAIARYHYLIDSWVEIPTLVVVLVTGALLFDIERLDGLYAVKVGCGLVAVLANVICVVPVFQRKYAADIADHAAVVKYTKHIFLTLIGGPAALTAMAIGMYWLSTGR